MTYFTIEELTASSTAQRLKISNAPSATIIAHLTELIAFLNVIREKWSKYCKEHGLGTPALIVSSGYRCATLNRAVGGVSTSAHLYGYAADLQSANGKQTAFECFMATEFAKKAYRYDQIIVEKSKTARWVHVGLKNAKGQQRRQIFKLNV